LVAQEGVLGEELFARAREIEHQASESALLYCRRHRTAHHRTCDPQQPSELQTEPAEHAAIEP
jgi:hypothetical protein